MKVTVKDFIENLEAIIEHLKELPDKTSIDVILDGDEIKSLDSQLKSDDTLLLYSIRDKR